jgi:hypothetical protein
MWDLESLKAAPPDAREFALTLRSTIVASEVDQTRLTDLARLSEEFGHLCIPFREHDVDDYASAIYGALLKHGANEVIVIDNPLYEGHSEHVALVDLRDKAARDFAIGEQFFFGGFIVATLSPLFRWIGNYRDFGFLFTEPGVTESVFGECFFTTYCDRSADFRLHHGGDELLDDQVRRLDSLWASRVAR